jgi:phosphopantetheinyl transferase (holo-ACP synthase)
VVGNDVVDLDFFGFPARQHVRHLSRVCTSFEASAVMRSPDPCRCLAMVWASKEATYKLVAKTEGIRRHFVPREFVLDVDRFKESNRKCRSKVSHKGVEARIEITVAERCVHAVATLRESRLVWWGVRELEQQYLDYRQARVESEAVRTLAGELLTKYGESDLVLEFLGRIPIVRRKSGGYAGMGISLSHHGAFVAVALARSIARYSVEKQLGNRLVENSSQGVMCSTSTA